MADNKVLITKEKKDQLEKELDQLIQVDRKKAIAAIQAAREQGDLSENADYDAAKNKQAEIEAKIKEIENILNFAEIIDEKKDGKKKDSNDEVKVGTKVEIVDLSDNETYCYSIVGEVEADPDKNKISHMSPLAQAILGHKKDQTVEVKGIEKPYKVKILKISRL